LYNKNGNLGEKERERERDRKGEKKKRDSYFIIETFGTSIVKIKEYLEKGIDSGTFLISNFLIQSFIM